VSFYAPELPPDEPVRDTDSDDPIYDDDEPVRDKKKADGSGWSPTVFWVGFGLTAVVGGVTIWSGIDTQNNPGPDKVSEECRDIGTSCDLYQEGLAKQNRTNALIGVTAGLGVTTLVIGAFLTDWSGGSSEEARFKAASPKASASGLSVQPWVNFDSGATLGATGRF
jgi:hypothetical protein